jgi:hypothetical protein
VLAPGEEYDDQSIGASGWVLNPHVSDEDLPMDHPFLKMDPSSEHRIDGDFEFEMVS